MWSLTSLRLTLAHLNMGGKSLNFPFKLSGVWMSTTAIPNRRSSQIVFKMDPMSLPRSGRDCLLLDFCEGHVFMNSITIWSDFFRSFHSHSHIVMTWYPHAPCRYWCTLCGLSLRSCNDILSHDDAGTAGSKQVCLWKTHPLYWKTVFD